MKDNSFKQYVFSSIDKHNEMKLEFHSKTINDIKISLNEIETVFDLETAKLINKKLEKYIRKQEKISFDKKEKDKIDKCEHKNIERTHPYGYIACKDCGKLL